MATKATTLFSLAKVKSHLEIETSNATKDAVIERIADGVSARVERMTGRVFVTRSVTEYLDGLGGTDLWLRNFPVVAITTLKARPDLSSAWETIGASSYEVDPLVGRIYLKDQAFYSGPRSVEVVYDAGYGIQDAATLPDDLVLAALNWVEFVWKRKGIGIVASSQNPGGGSSVVVIPEPPKDLRDAIMSFRKIRGVYIR